MSDEHDDELAERRLLASAYLDGEVTADERTRAEGDPAVLAEIEALRSVRQRLGADLPPADAERRNAVVAAALAAATPTVRRPPAPSALAHRRARWFAPAVAAAAAAVIVVGGVVALRNGGEDDDSALTSATTERSEPASAADASTAETAGAGGGAEAEETTRASAGGQAVTTAAAAAETSAAEETTADATEGTAAGGRPGEAATDTFAQREDLVVRDGPELIALVELLTAEDSASGTDTPPNPEAPPCELGTFVSLARYQPSATLAPRDIAVFVDATGAVVAADAVTCEVVLRTTR